MEAVKSYRELFVANRQEQYINKVSILRLDLAKSLAEINFMPFIGKYVIEASMILGIMLLGATQFLFNSPVEAATTLSIFLAASTRIAPAILRAQQSLLQIKGALGIAGDTLTLFGELKESSRTREYYISRGILEVEKTFEPRIEIKNLHFGYPNSSTEIFEDFNLVIESGIVALTGPSGSGKSTLLDLILGLLDPTDGQIFLSNLRPRDAIRRWEGSISYAPQETILIDGTIRENITGGEEKKYSDEEIVESLVATDLYEFVMSLDKGLETQVGENGAQLSGGQKQRLGISRAILSKPRLLILDEATSSLDINSETKILKSLKSFSLDTTILFVTHRISTLENIQKIIYMRNGRIIASGNFAQIGELFLELNEDL
jgi:ABC-type multidrug transport system fused ATPase/permease subunit